MPVSLSGDRLFAIDLFSLCQPYNLFLGQLYKSIVWESLPYNERNTSYFQRCVIRNVNVVLSHTVCTLGNS